MRILLSIKAILNYLYNNLIDLVWTKKIRFADGTEIDSVDSLPKGNSLFDIKLLSQAIADKGWAFMCHTTRRDLPKTDVPTLYNDILDKLNNSTKEMQPLTQLSLMGTKILYCNTLNKWFYTNQSKVYETNNLISSNVFLNDNISQMICGNNVFIAYVVYGTNAGKYVIVNLNNNETKYITLSSDIPLNSGAVRSIVKDGYIYVCSTNRSDYTKIYKFYDDFSITDFETITFSKNIYDIQYDNGYWYVLLADGVYKGTDINNPESFTKIYQSTIYNASFLIVKGNFSCFLKSRGYPIVYTYDLYQNVQQTSYNADISYSSNIGSYPKLLNNLIWTQTVVSNYNLYITSIDINDFSKTTYVQKAVSGLDIDYNTNTVVIGTPDYIYFTGLVNKEYTDTYNIDGTNVNIKYYKNNDFKICLADGGTNDTNLETLYNYLGYLNYWLLDLTNETVCVQRDKNTYSAMFVGDDFIDDLEDLPTNDYSSVVLKNHLLNIASALISADTINNLQDGTKDTVYQTSAPTLIIAGRTSNASDWYLEIQLSADGVNFITVARYGVSNGDPASSAIIPIIVGSGVYWKVATSLTTGYIKYGAI